MNDSKIEKLGSRVAARVARQVLGKSNYVEVEFSPNGFGVFPFYELPKGSSTTDELHRLFGQAADESVKIAYAMVKELGLRVRLGGSTPGIVFEKRFSFDFYATYWVSVELNEYLQEELKILAGREGYQVNT